MRKILERLNLKQKYRNWYWSERILKKSKNKNAPKYYIIRRVDQAGLMSIVTSTLGHIMYAVEKGYIPVVDMKHYKNAYLKTEDIGKKNAWELFFEQPMGISLEEALESKDIILSNGYPIEKRPNDSMSFYENRENEQLYWREQFQKYIRIKEDIQKDIKEEFEGIVHRDDTVLGVIVRGTDYVKNKPSQHPIQPSIDEVIMEAKKMMKEKNCNKIFVATEDKNYDEIFRKTFKEKYITNKKTFLEYSGGALPLVRSGREDEEFLNGKEYLTTLWMLSKCHYLLAARNSGSVAVMLMTTGYLEEKIFDLGRYL